MTIKAVGFDLDGTLVNTHVNYVDLNDVNRFVLEPLGFPVDEIWADRSLTSRQPFYEWMERHGRKTEIPRFDRLLDERCLEVERLGMTGSQVYSGIIDTLSWLKDNGYKLGVVTRNTRFAARIFASSDSGVRMISESTAHFAARGSSTRQRMP